MAGVAGPMYRTSRAAGARFLAGLLAGEVAAAALIAVPFFLAGEALKAVLTAPARLWAVAAICAVLGAADLANRTPRVQRQVPESLIGRLPPATLGLAWGFDLGLLFTTQKAVSLIWAAIAAIVLLDPAMAAGLTIGIAVITVLTVTTLSIWRRPGRNRLATWGSRLRLARQGSGLMLIGIFAFTAVQAWHA
jgi:hypothetical protein